MSKSGFHFLLKPRARRCSPELMSALLDGRYIREKARGGEGVHGSNAGRQHLRMERKRLGLSETKTAPKAGC